jgi:Sel1 repeat-containing protein
MQNGAMLFKKPRWGRVMAKYRRGVAAGDLAAIRDLGLTLAEGIQDQNGRSLVRRNSLYAARLLRRAAEQGDPAAAASLGLAYDVGNGVRANRPLAIKWYRRAVELGDSTAAANLATVYRDSGALRVAHRWLLRAAEMGDGDAAVTAGYGYLHGIGVPRNESSARRLLNRALRVRSISAYGREEALYLMALANVDRGNQRKAIPLLKRASKDGDYPEATLLLTQIKENSGLRPCRCRRHLPKNLAGHAPCPVHHGRRR